MKLKVKTSRYILAASCGCTKSQQTFCGITYRVG
jgi:hypothetical protein